MGRNLFGLSRHVCAKRRLLPEQFNNGWQVGLNLSSTSTTYLCVARCVLATLNSNMEVSLWAATKNHLKGEWIKAGSHVDTKRLQNNPLARSKISLPFWANSFPCLMGRHLLRRYFRFKYQVRCFLAAGLYELID